VAEHHQRPLPRNVKSDERGERANHATADRSAPAKVRRIETQSPRGREDDAPAHGNQAHTNHGEQPASHEIADHRQRGKGDHRRASHEQRRQYHQQKHLQREKTYREDQRNKTKQSEKGTTGPHDHRATEHHEDRAVKTLPRDRPRQHRVRQDVDKRNRVLEREAIQQQPKHGANYS
jgi:hypothetical protein